MRRGNAWTPGFTVGDRVSHDVMSKLVAALKDSETKFTAKHYREREQGVVLKNKDSDEAPTIAFIPYENLQYVRNANAGDAMQVGGTSSSKTDSASESASASTSESASESESASKE